MAQPSLLHELFNHIQSYAPVYNNVTDGNVTFVNVRLASDVIMIAEGFIRLRGISAAGMSTAQLALVSCNNLIRMRLLVIVNQNRYRWIVRRSNCYVHLRPSRSISRRRGRTNR